MKLFALSFIIGFVINFFYFSPLNGLEIYPNEYLHKEPSPSSKNLKAYSGNDQYYVQYQKVGKEIEFYSTAGEKFWKLKSLEYPYLSYQGRLIFLMNGDHSQIRIINYHGKEIGVKKVVGRMCTIISFSPENDYGAIGFLDGSFYVINESGQIIFSNPNEHPKPIKGLALSNQGLFTAVHQGDDKKDFLQIFNLANGEISTVKLNHTHLAKTALTVNDQGETAILDQDRILFFNPQGSLNFSIKIPPPEYGSASLAHYKNLFLACYPQKNKRAKVILFKNKGEIIFSKEFEEENYLQGQLKENSIILEGIEHLYGYNFH